MARKAAAKTDSKADEKPTNQEPAKRGRPSSYCQEVADEICHRVAEGEPLREVCRDERMPAWRTVYDWMAANDDFSARIAKARHLGGHAIAYDALHLADQMPPTDDNGRTDSGYVSWQKLRIDTRLKLLAKWFPKDYGDKLDLNHSGSLTVNPTDLTDDQLAAIATSRGG